ncbi:MAG: ribose 5-phosphate isomerase B [Acholeplasmatales bacterium]|jgi:ribose 5-phosphate isomerase B|nr:ribose 5-phosphate isomerase B [Acholeplasmatales bacterium]
MEIAITSDHGGLELKNKIVEYYKNTYNIHDLGVFSNLSVDYPDVAKNLYENIIANNYDFSIAICGTGIGISIALNKFNGIRCALVYQKEVARLAKEHNNANVIALGGRFMSINLAISMIDEFINSKYDDRHEKRIDKIKKIEEEC